MYCVIIIKLFICDYCLVRLFNKYWFKFYEDIWEVVVNIVGICEGVWVGGCEYYGFGEIYFGFWRMSGNLFGMYLFW